MQVQLARQTYLQLAAGSNAFGQLGRQIYPRELDRAPDAANKHTPNALSSCRVPITLTDMIWFRHGPPSHQSSSNWALCVGCSPVVHNALCVGALAFVSSTYRLSNFLAKIIVGQIGWIMKFFRFFFSRKKPLQILFFSKKLLQIQRNAVLSTKRPKFSLEIFTC